MTFFLSKGTFTAPIIFIWSFLLLIYIITILYINLKVYQIFQPDGGCQN